VVSHETVTMAGYDIPEPNKIKAINLDCCKHITLTNITCDAESYRKDRTSYDYEKKLK